MTARHVSSVVDTRMTRIKVVVTVVGAAAAVVGVSMARSRTTVREFVGPTMGSTYAVSIDADLTVDDVDRVRRAIDARLARVNDLMSTYDATSEISRFNQHESTEPFALSEEVLSVLTMAQEMSRVSDGAFDVTVAPLVDAWGLGPRDLVGPLPDEERLAALLPLVGYRGLHIDLAGGTVSKANPGIEVDLSAIAQGYASDFVASALRELGFSDFFVDVGGEIRVSGTRRNGRAWRVGIERPDGAAEVWGTAELSDEGIATSGDYRNYFEKDGARYAHIIDPRTGQPIHTRNASVTVIHTTAALADAWATALCVLGPDDGFELARREGVAALFITQVDGRLEYRATPAMEGRFAVE